MRLTERWTWLGWVAFFFAWGFVVHGVGLVLHEVGGHGLAATILGYGIERINLTYFGHGLVRSGSSTPWAWTSRVFVEWAGLAVTISAGAAAMVSQRRAGLPPLTRLLLAILATALLLGQLDYATAGGFYEVGDPALTAVILESHGLHILAWLPPLVLYTAAALYGARAIVGAFREHFGSRSRLHTLKQITATLGAAGLLYFVAFHVEAADRTDMFHGLAAEADGRRAMIASTPRFPIQRVTLAIAVAAFILALARPVRRREEAEDAAPRIIPRRHAMGIAGAALMCAVMITLLVRV